MGHCLALDVLEAQAALVRGTEQYQPGGLLQIALVQVRLTLGVDEGDVDHHEVYTAGVEPDLAEAVGV